MDLLKWRTHPDRIMDGLSKLKDMDGTEIVKVKRFLKTSIILQIPVEDLSEHAVNYSLLWDIYVEHVCWCKSSSTYGWICWEHWLGAPNSSSKSITTFILYLVVSFLIISKEDV